MIISNPKYQKQKCYNKIYLNEDLNFIKKQIFKYSLDINNSGLNSNNISLKDIVSFKNPVIWTFHDMWPFLDTAHLDYKKIKKKNGIN